MTDRHGGGVSGGRDRDRDTARSALRELVMAATVRIHRPGAGYAPEESGGFLGSGFFIAPNWVLTCAHVVHGGEGDGGEVTVICRPGPFAEPYVVPAEVAATLPEQAERSVQGDWPDPDLALVRLREPVEHECLYVSERPSPQYTEGQVFYAGWAPVRGRPQPLDGFLAVHGTVGGRSAGARLSLGGSVLPPGVSGGPVIDPVRGEVVGVLRPRADHGPGGTSIGIEQLRTLPVTPPTRPPDRYGHGLSQPDWYGHGHGLSQPDWYGHGHGLSQPDPSRPDLRRPAPYRPDLYQTIWHAHDRYHRDRQLPGESGRRTWVGLQAELGARPGRVLSPYERVELLGRLADLEPPESTRGLLDILQSLPDFRAPTPSPAPRGWRDGLGALYENARYDGALPLVVEYAMRVMTAERPVSSPVLDAEEALWGWIRQAATRLGSGRHGDLARRRARHLGDRLGEPDGRRGTGYPHESARGPSAEPPLRLPARLSVLLQVEHLAWDPEHCDWSVAVVRRDGEVTPLDEGRRVGLDGLAACLAAPLAEAFRRCDEPDRPVALYAALPHHLLDLPVDEWRLRPGADPLGGERPVLVRCADRGQMPGEDDRDDRDDRYDAGLLGDDEEPDRRDRWRRLHGLPGRDTIRAAILDCDDAVRRPVPAVSVLRGLPPGTVPVLCREGDRSYEDDDTALARIVRAGYGVVLWRRWRRPADPLCGEFHREARTIVDGAAGAAELPALVHGLRDRMCEGLAESFWARGIALLYDDPDQPLPGGDDLLEAP
ncbi:VMAP-C domain-containing protein [Streptomyces fuscichromogenes]|uniref:Serine protease n=1 Tax=Streptomyces fuscichromogenes TaxID=1324013 RepID=A0A918CWU1_9ACTN|nr:trypsin-like peptidase domain-containing protein [Streptomyces fuscichromogenes]GGN41464.1 serine protease [Streptomyces fuscichromogenes]